MRRRWLAGQVRFGGQQKEVVDAVEDVLGRHVLLTFLHTAHWAVHAVVGHGKRVLFILQNELAAEGKDKVLKDVHWGFAAEGEDAVGK